MLKPIQIYVTDGFKFVGALLRVALSRLISMVCVKEAQESLLWWHDLCLRWQVYQSFFFCNWGVYSYVWTEL